MRVLFVKESPPAEFQDLCLFLQRVVKPIAVMRNAGFPERIGDIMNAKDRNQNPIWYSFCSSKTIFSSNGWNIYHFCIVHTHNRFYASRGYKYWSTLKKLKKKRKKLVWIENLKTYFIHSEYIFSDYSFLKALETLFMRDYKGWGLTGLNTMRLLVGLRFDDA